METGEFSRPRIHRIQDLWICAAGFQRHCAQNPWSGLNGEMPIAWQPGQVVWPRVNCEGSLNLSTRNSLRGRGWRQESPAALFPHPVLFTSYSTILVTFQSAHRVGRHVARKRLSKRIPSRAWGPEVNTAKDSRASAISAVAAEKLANARVPGRTSEVTVNGVSSPKTLARTEAAAPLTVE
jgi:hypothetical protein